MTPMQALQQHQQLCDEIHQLALEENSFLQQHRRAPDAHFLERKKLLLTRLDETLSTLRTTPRHSARESQSRQLIEKIRSRILQILQLDRENEQLLLRYSLASAGATPAQAVTPSVSFLQKVYQRHG